MIRKRLDGILEAGVDRGSILPRLCGELAAAIAREVSWGRKGDTCHSNGLSDRKAAISALESYGLVHAVLGEPAKRALSMDADEMRTLLAATTDVDDHDPRLQGLLQGYVRNLDYRQPAIMTTRREPFECPPDQLTVVQALTEAGYLEAVGSRFRWTDKIGPSMVAAYVWNENFQSIEEAEEQSRERMADEILRTMPDALVQHFKDSPNTLFDMWRILGACWKDGAWHAEGLSEHQYEIELEGGMLLARRVMEKFIDRHS
jgi:hypothetical protein